MLLVEVFSIVSKLWLNSPCLGSLQQGEDEGQEQRPEVRDEDLNEAKDKLGTRGPMKSKTFEVMEECGELKSSNSVLWVQQGPWYLEHLGLHWLR